ncbi:MAG: transposase [Sphaerochaetaceae bacterium]|nr:transposase [Sphaerochaetaceae bacterium]
MYSEELKEQVLKLYLEHRRTIGSLADEFGLSKSGINKWIKQYRENAERDEKLKQALETMEENRRLHRKIEELEKENDFLKKAAAFFAKESKQ